MVVTPTVIWALGTLVLGGGIYALNHEQVNDMGQRVYDRYISIGGTNDSLIVKGMETLKTGLIIKDKLVSALDWVTGNLPIEKISIPKDITVGANGKFNFGVSSTKLPLISTLAVFTVSGGYAHYVGHDFRYSTKPYTVTVDSYMSGLTKVFVLRFNGDGLSQVNKHIYERDFIDLSFDSLISAKGYNDIPYDNEKVKENYKPGLLPQALPYTDSKPGYLPVPNAIPDDNSISTDLPLSWDNVKDNVTDFPIDGSIDIPIDGDISIPSDDVSNPSVGSFWGWLLDILKAILNAIKSIVNFLTTFFVKLMEMFMDLIKALFIPGDNFFNDNFNKIKTNFGNKLSYKSYIDLFDKTYAGNGIKDITINWQGQELVIVKLSEFNNFRSFFNSACYAFFFFLLAIYNYNQVYRVIRTIELVGPGSPIAPLQLQMSPGPQIQLGDSNQRRLN